MRELFAMIFKSIFGPDAEMSHPHTRAEVKAKLGEAAENIEKMSEATDRLAKFQTARSVDDALRQMTRVG